MRKTLFFFAIVAVFHLPLHAQQHALQPVPGASETVQLARYSTSSLLPPQSASNPLAVVASVSFPRALVQNVGDAARHLLARTGYQLVDATQLELAAQGLLRLPLPESHRHLGPYRVDAMLQTLLGEPWQVQIDPITRSVRFSALSAASGVGTVAAPAVPLAASVAPNDPAISSPIRN